MSLTYSVGFAMFILFDRYLRVCDSGNKISYILNINILIYINILKLYSKVNKVKVFNKI